MTPRIPVLSSLSRCDWDKDQECGSESRDNGTDKEGGVRAVYHRITHARCIYLKTGSSPFTCKIQREEYVHGGWNTLQRRGGFWRVISKSGIEGLGIRRKGGRYVAGFANTFMGAGGVVGATYFSKRLTAGRESWQDLLTKPRRRTRYSQLDGCATTHALPVKRQRLRRERATSSIRSFE